MDLKQPRIKCKKCGFEIPDNQDSRAREWKPGVGRLGCENCARGAISKARGRKIAGEQMEIEAPTLKI